MKQYQPLHLALHTDADYAEHEMEIDDQYDVREYARLKYAQDGECAKAKAEAMLLQILRDHGYDDIVEAYLEIPRS